MLTGYEPTLEVSLIPEDSIEDDNFRRERGPLTVF